MTRRSGELVLEAENLQKSYFSGTREIEVLRSVDLRLETGRSLSIRGESGCGKSTLLNLIAGIEKPDAGRVVWNGLPLDEIRAHHLNARRATYLGFVFQAYYLIPELNALENVLLAGRIAGSSARASRQRALALLDKLGLSERLQSQPHQLSGGERQRVAIARALLNKPLVVLADEPTGNLDEQTAMNVMQELFSAVTDCGASLVLVTHNPSFAAMTEASLLLHSGTLVPDTKAPLT